MATENVDLVAGAAYVLVVPESKSSFLLSCPEWEEVAYATGVDDDTPPANTVKGHRMRQFDGMTRGLLKGSVFARAPGKVDVTISRDMED